MDNIPQGAIQKQIKQSLLQTVMRLSVMRQEKWLVLINHTQPPKKGTLATNDRKASAGLSEAKETFQNVSTQCAINPFHTTIS